jgi:hypothetical protein
MEIPEYETRLDELFAGAFGTNHPATLDWVKVKFELKSLREKGEELEPVQEVWNAMG